MPVIEIAVIVSTDQNGSGRSAGSAGSAGSRRLQNRSEVSIQYTVFVVSLSWLCLWKWFAIQSE